MVSTSFYFPFLMSLSLFFPSVPGGYSMSLPSENINRNLHRVPSLLLESKATTVIVIDVSGNDELWNGVARTWRLLPARGVT